MRLICKRLFSNIIIILLITAINVPIIAGAKESADSVSLDSSSDKSYISHYDSYSSYLSQYSKEKYPSDQIVVNGINFSCTNMQTEVRNFDGCPCVVTQEEGYIEWNVNVSSSGLYNIKIDYYSVDGKGVSSERELQIDGTTPFDEARFLTFSRTWKDSTDKFPTDKNGNQTRPNSEEVSVLHSVDLKDPMGYEEAPLYFYFSKGNHKIRFISVREPLAISKITIYQSYKIFSYEEYLKNNQAGSGSDVIRLEAENANYKSDSSIYAYNDRASATTNPQDPYKILLNCIGGTKWQNVGQYLTWNFHINHSGYYQIIPRTRQNTRNGTFVSRKVLIDGLVPFTESGNISFKYSTGWKENALSYHDKKLLFYLDKGDHSITMEVVLGDFGKVLGEVNDCINKLNEIYRQILMVTGPSPDTYRDYEFPTIIPDTLKRIDEQASNLAQTTEELLTMTGEKGSDTAILDKLVFQLKTMSDDPEKIAFLLSDFQSNISSLGTWALTTRQQPLELDQITIAPEDYKSSNSGNNLFKQITFDIKSFIASFLVDYEMIGTAGNLDTKGSVDVWMVSGRDQAEIIRNIADSTFTKQYGYYANIKLVSTGMLLPSVLSDEGPDVSLFNSCNDPINYAIRKAAVDLSVFDTYEDVIKRFPSQSMTSYQFKGGTYALPETIVFPMMFYRKDIFAELGITPPTTWKDFYKIIPELQKKNMTIGFPANLVGLELLLYQAGGSLYSSNLSKCTLNEDMTIDAFIKQTNLFTVYKFPAQYDAANRFRTGEMPLLIADYTLANQLSVYAPEIRGMWEFVCVPETIREDGTVNGVSPISNVGVSTQTSSGVVSITPTTGAMILSSSKNKKAAWNFLDWWTSNQTQSSFCSEMEVVLGSAAKQPTANFEALSALPWTATEYKNLSVQFNKLQGTPEIPGGYYISRYFDFAFAEVYNDNQPADRSIIKYTPTVNDEINRKSEEFGLNK